jgi:hypothetical protein
VQVLTWKESFGQQLLIASNVSNVLAGVDRRPVEVTKKNMFLYYESYPGYVTCKGFLLVNMIFPSGIF